MGIQCLCPLICLQTLLYLALFLFRFLASFLKKLIRVIDAIFINTIVDVVFIRRRLVLFTFLSNTFVLHINSSRLFDHKGSVYFSSVNFAAFFLSEGVGSI